MNIKKILLLIMILAIASAICISPGFATTKTTDKIYFDTSKKSGTVVTKKIGSQPQDQVMLFYNFDVAYTNMPAEVQTKIIVGELNGEDTIYKMVRAKVTFIKKIGSKKYYSTKTLKSKDGGITYNAKNGYKPYYARVTYTDVETTKQLNFNTKKDGASVSKEIDSFNKVQLRYNTVSSNSQKIQTNIITKQNTEYTKENKLPIIKLLSAKVTFVKKVGSKNQYTTKTLKPKNGEISYNAKEGYKPHNTKITYKWVYSKPQ